MMLFREDGQVDLARAGRGGRDVLVCVDLRLEVRVDLHLSRVRVRARVRVIVRPKIRVRVISSPHRDAVFVVLEAAGKLIEGAQRGTPRAEAQQLTHPCDLRAEHLGINEAGVED